MYTALCVETLVASLKAAGKSKAEIVQQSSALCIGWPYVFAAAGEMCTPKWRRNRMGYSNEKYRQAILDNCPVLSKSLPLEGKVAAKPTDEVACTGCKWDGCRCFDCRGFTRWLLLQVGLYIHGATVTTQWETASNWVAKGTNIQDMPRGLACCVFRPGHTGMHVGDGVIRHCSGTVKEETLPGTPNWQKWAIPAGLYTTDELRKAGLNVDESKNIPILRRGSQGDEVEELQALLNAKYGANLDVDSIFGAKTEAAVKAFQKAKGLTADGIVGPKTRAALGLAFPQDTNANGNVSTSETPNFDQFADHAAGKGDGSTEDTALASMLVALPRVHLIELKACLSDALNIVNSALAGSD